MPAFGGEIVFLILKQQFERRRRQSSVGRSKASPPGRSFQAIGPGGGRQARRRSPAKKKKESPTGDPKSFSLTSMRETRRDQQEKPLSQLVCEYKNSHWRWIIGPRGNPFKTRLSPFPETARTAPEAQQYVSTPRRTHRRQSARRPDARPSSHEFFHSSGGKHLTPPPVSCLLCSASPMLVSLHFRGALMILMKRVSSDRDQTI